MDDEINKNNSSLIPFVSQDISFHKQDFDTCHIKHAIITDRRCFRYHSLLGHGNFDTGRYICPLNLTSFDPKETVVDCLIMFNSLSFAAFILFSIIFFFISKPLSSLQTNISVLLISFAQSIFVILLFLKWNRFTSEMFLLVSLFIFSIATPVFKLVEATQIEKSTEAQFIESSLHLPNHVFQEIIRICTRIALLLLWIFFISGSQRNEFIFALIFVLLLTIYSIMNTFAYYDKNKLLAYKYFRSAGNNIAEGVLKDEIVYLQTKISELQKTLSFQNAIYDKFEFQEYIKKDQESSSKKGDEFPYPYMSESVLRENVSTLRRHLVYLTSLLPYDPTDQTFSRNPINLFPTEEEYNTKINKSIIEHDSTKNDEDW